MFIYNSYELFTIYNAYKISCVLNVLIYSVLSTLKVLFRYNLHPLAKSKKDCFCISTGFDATI